MDKNIVDVDLAIKQLLSAVIYLHANNIVHCDIKPENIMYKNGMLKLIDLGLSYRKFDDLDKLNGLNATTCFITPIDVLMGNKYYGYDLDIWGCAVTIYYLLTNNYPFYYSVIGATEIIYINMIFRVLGSPTDVEWKTLSYVHTKDDFTEHKFIGLKDTKYTDILYKMFKYVGEDRPSAGEVLEMVNNLL